MRRIVIVFLTLLLLWVLVAQLNHSLSEAHVYLFVGGLFVAYSALALRLREGLIVSFLAGLLCDSAIPIEIGTSRIDFALAHTHALLFAVAHLIVFKLRERIPREETTARVLVALFTNLGIFLLLSVAEIGRSPAPAAAWWRIAVDLLCSQIFLVLIAPWFFALQTKALELIRTERDSVA